jgi:hypothetical protein
MSSSLSPGGRQRSSLQGHLNQLDDIEAQSRYEEETADRGIGALHHIRSRTRSRTNETVIGWEHNDPENPYNWSNVSLILCFETFSKAHAIPQSKKTIVLFTSGMLVINSTLGSALPSMAIPKITAQFNVTVRDQMVLPISVYLIGYVFGPIIWGPLSEHLGRRILSILTFSAFCAFTLACGFAPNWPAFLVFRFFCGVSGSAPIAVVAGILADVYNEPKTRGRAFAIFMAVSLSNSHPLLL